MRKEPFETQELALARPLTEYERALDAKSSRRAREMSIVRFRLYVLLTRFAYMVVVLRGNGSSGQEGEHYRSDHHQPGCNSRHAQSSAVILQVNFSRIPSNGACEQRLYREG